MQRLPDWEARLRTVIDANVARAFDWASGWDCCMWVAEVVIAMTGVDPAAAYRGKYRTEAGARLALAKYGRGSLASTFDAAFGASVAPAFAGRGDIILTTDGNAGVCMGGFALLVGDTGLVRVPRADWARSWVI